MKDQLDALINQMVEHGVHYEDAMSEFQKRFIKKVLDKHNGNRSKAAQILGIHRNTLSRKMDEVSVNHQPKRRKRTRAGAK
ncbi:MAG TPA: helix-turn-helix domain-containing protein [Terriglobia bacterium]|nr:helix-turn-helix domain-containing protein [Terriglobia bacterium]